MNEKVNDALLAKLPEIQQRLFILFSSYKDFNSFGNKAWAVAQNLSSWDSIEAIHDIIHIYGGLKGHMTYVPLSSFDPLFFIHHISTDRLIAMWQVLNPTAWISPMATGETSYTAPKGTIQTSQTPLTPFYINQDGRFWDSDMARDTVAFGYTYADTDPTLASSGDLREDLNKKITEWYGGSSVIGLTTKSRQPPLHPHQVRDIVGDSFRLKYSKPNVKVDAQDPPVNSIIKNGQYTEWVANVHVNVEALDGTFSIPFFLGKVPDNPCLRGSSPNEIGSVDIFAMDRMTGSRSKISGTVPLTSALTKIVAVGVLPHLNPKVVEPFLRHVLQFRVCGSNDTEVDPRLVEGLHVRVSSAQVVAPASDAELPKWGSPIMRIEMWT